MQMHAPVNPDILSRHAAKGVPFSRTMCGRAARITDITTDGARVRCPGCLSAIMTHLAASKETLPDEVREVVDVVTSASVDEAPLALDVPAGGLDDLDLDLGDIDVDDLDLGLGLEPEAPGAPPASGGVSEAGLAQVRMMLPALIGEPNPEALRWLSDPSDEDVLTAPRDVDGPDLRSLVSEKHLALLRMAYQGLASAGAEDVGRYMLSLIHDVVVIVRVRSR